MAVLLEAISRDSGSFREASTFNCPWEYSGYVAIISVSGIIIVIFITYVVAIFLTKRLLSVVYFLFKVDILYVFSLSYTLFNLIIISVSGIALFKSTKTEKLFLVLNSFYIILFNQRRKQPSIFKTDSIFKIQVLELSQPTSYNFTVLQ